MNQRTPDFRQLQPNFTIQVVTWNANNSKKQNNNNKNNNFAGDDKRAVSAQSVGTPGFAALTSDPGDPNDGHEQHEQPDDGVEQQRQLPATLQLTVAQGRKFSARTSRSQRTRISLFKGEYKTTQSFLSQDFVTFTHFLYGLPWQLPIGRITLQLTLHTHSLHRRHSMWWWGRVCICR